MPTPIRNIRIPQDLWDAVGVKAEQEGRDRATVVREALEKYVARPIPAYRLRSR